MGEASGTVGLKIFIGTVERGFGGSGCGFRDTDEVPGDVCCVCGTAGMPIGFWFGTGLAGTPDPKRFQGTDPNRLVNPGYPCSPSN